MTVHFTSTLATLLTNAHVPMPADPNAIPPRCPVCGYNRSGENSGHCPECGTDQPPIRQSRRTIGLDLVWMMFPCATAWLTAFALMVGMSYEHGVFVNDRWQRIGVSVFTGILVAASFMAWRRRARLSRLPLLPGYLALAVLIALTLAGLIAALRFLADPRA